MTSSLSTVNTLEGLPDEVLLLICRYLSSIDILSAFYGLNTRLSQTISGYCQYVFLGHVSYRQLTYVCSSILPKIGLNIHSLIVSDEWQGLLSKVFLEYFGERISSIFPKLKCLTLISFTFTSLKLFLSCLEDVPELNELDIRFLSAENVDNGELGVLLHQLFTINKNRLTSLSLPDDSISFHLDAEDHNVSYPNIENLTIKLQRLGDFHTLLTVLPRIHVLDVIIKSSYFEFVDETPLPPVCELKDFSLKSLESSWDLGELTTILKRIPNVEKLSLKILTLSDPRLICGDEFFSELSTLSLKAFNYTLFFFCEPSIEQTMIISTWQQRRQEIIQIESDVRGGSLLYTLSFITTQLNISYKLISVVNNSDLIKRCGIYIKLLVLSDIPSQISKSYIILTSCRRLKHLTITIDEYIQPPSTQQINLRTLPCLTSLVLLGISSIESKDFQALLEASPNLYNLTITYGILETLFDSESICQLLGQRITDLKITLYSGSMELNTIVLSRLASIFSHLRHLCFDGDDDIIETSEPLIIAALNHLSNWNSLISLSILHMPIMKETCDKNIHQWVSEHISVQDHSPFLSDCTSNSFQLWL